MEPSDILDLMIGFELAISKLYALFAKQFPLHAEFWKGLARDEALHASWIKQLKGFEAGGKVWKTDRFKSQAVQTSIRSVEIQIEKAQRGEIHENEAFSLADDLETAYLEQRFYMIFESDNPGFRRVKEKLMTETQNHQKKIKAFLT